MSRFLALVLAVTPYLQRQHRRLRPLLRHLRRPKHRPRLRRHDGNRTTIDYNVKNNGRGPTMAETITFGPDGLPTAWTISGTTTFGSKVNETFKRDKSRATWLDSTGKGQASPKEPAVYVAQSGSPWSLQVYARALLKQPA
jgi:hypothetical protein